MAVLKCKMCGGSLEVLEGDSIAKCEYCGTLQTIPIDKGEKILNLYDRASHYRRNNDYDKALEIYESILNENTKDAEAYWSIILCKYGIEYVEDPETGRRVPTVNRTQPTSIFADEDYKSAIEYADERQREIYEHEAEEIDKIQKGILEISSKEEPFDIFICYKETDDAGRRTRDSVLAQELYYGLTDAGFKVFFSRITLENKLGSEYEPYIYAALSSAKVMVAVGTKRTHFESPWVKNEWSRFLALTKTDSDKVLIPAYRDMDPYDLPEEFSHLQAQDMAKLGFMQDTIRGIKKIIGATLKRNSVVIENNIQTGITAESLLARTYLFLEDGEYEKANEYVERILDINPMCAEGYLCNMLVDYRVHNKNGLLMCVSPLDENKDYEKIMRFGSEELKAEMIAINEKIKAQNRARLTNNAKQGIYDRADELSHYDDPLKLEKAASEFRSLGDWKDAEVRAEECLARKSLLEREQADAAFECAEELKKSNNPNKILEAVHIFEKLGTYRNANELVSDCMDLVNIKRDAIYDKAMQLRSTNIEGDIKKAKSYFDFLGGYRDAKEKSTECREELEKIKAERTAVQSSPESTNTKIGHKGRTWIVIAFIVLSIIITVIVNALNANVSDVKSFDDFKFSKVATGYEVTKMESNKSHINIPSKIDGEPVVGISAHAFKDKRSLVGVTIPSSVSYIEQGAFSDCVSLVNMTLPDEIESIEAYVFHGCVSLTRINLPSDLRVIDEYAFYGCKSLYNIDIPDSVTEIGERAFAECDGLVSVDLPRGIKSISDYTFYGCNSLLKVNIPGRVTTIGEYAFYNCSSLTSIKIPSSVTHMSDYAIADTDGAKVFVEAEQRPNGWATLAILDADIYYYSESDRIDGKYWHYVNGTPSIW